MSPVLGSLEPTAEKLHDSPEHAGGFITALGGRLPGGSTMVTVVVAVAVTPHSSRAVSVTV